MNCVIVSATEAPLVRIKRNVEEAVVEDTVLYSLIE